MTRRISTLSADFAAAERLADHLRRKRVDAAYFAGRGICVLDFKHITEQHQENPLLEVLETILHEFTHHLHPTWNDRKVERHLTKLLPARRDLLTEFVRGLKT